MSEKKLMQVTYEGNVYRLPRSHHRRSTALVVRQEPKVPAVIHSGPLVAAGLAAFLVWALLRKD